MGAFDVLSIANTSLGMHQTWLDALANNIANVNTIRPTSGPAFQATMLEAQALPNGAGVEVSGLKYSSAAGRPVYDPSNPMADANGMVLAPDMDLSDQMSELVMAQRGFQAQVQVTKNAQETYTAALQIGRG